MHCYKRALVYAVLCVVVCGDFGCSNVFTDMADQTTDAARLYEAKLLINDHDYTGAIAQITGMTSTGQASDSAQVTLASAYAGRCGLDAITLALNLGNAGSTNLFSILLSGFPAPTASVVSDCKQARTILTAMASPSVDEDILLALVAFATIGAELNHDYDANQDGVLDAGVGWCQVTPNPFYPALPTPSPMSDADTVDVFVNIAWALNAIANAGSTIGGTGVGAINTLCATLPPAQAGICNRTNPALYSPADILVLRGVIASNQGLGIGLCNNSVTNCACP